MTLPDIFELGQPQSLAEGSPADAIERWLQRTWTVADAANGVESAATVAEAPAALDVS